MKEASDYMLASFGGVGAPSITCTCGRRHHAPGGCEVSESEERDMRDDKREDPTKVQLHENCDSVYAKCIGDMTVVPDCPCGWLGRFEEIIWSERERIIAYYKNRRAADAKALEHLDGVTPSDLAAADAAIVQRPK